MIIEGERPSKKRYLDPERLEAMAHGFTRITPGTNDWKEMVRAASFGASASTNVMLGHVSNIRTSLEPAIIPMDYAAGFLIAHAALEDFSDNDETELDIILDRGFDLFIRNLTSDRLLQTMPIEMRRARMNIIKEIVQDLKDGMYLDIPPESQVPSLLNAMRDNANRVTQSWESDFEDRYGCDPVQIAEHCLPLDLPFNPEETMTHIISLATGILDAHELHRTSSNLETTFVVA